MERLFYQDEWQGIFFRDMSVPACSGVVGREFYSRFYRTLLSRNSRLSSNWMEVKRKVGEWLEAEFLQRPQRQQLRVCSVGAGLGVVEDYFWSQGHRVDVLECQGESLRYLRSYWPQTMAVIADARYIPFRSNTYDLVYMSAVDYCFDRSQYEMVLGEMRRLVKVDGKVVCVCVSNLSLNGILRGMFKTVLRRGAVKRDFETGKVAWGYQRTVGEHLSVGRNAGLICERVYLFDHEFMLRTVRQSGLLHLGWSTARDYVVAVAFRRAT